MVVYPMMSLELALELELEDSSLESSPDENTDARLLSCCQHSLSSARDSRPQRAFGDDRPHTVSYCIRRQVLSRRNEPFRRPCNCCSSEQASTVTVIRRAFQQLPLRLGWQSIWGVGMMMRCVTVPLSGRTLPAAAMAI
ncbi:hypothetical protein BST61_g8515 [Cercospora zeina]